MLTPQNGIALEEADAADTVLWCHSLRMGELRLSELAALRQYAARSHSIWKTCFVLTHEDNVASYSIICEVSQVIARQLEEVFDLRFHGVGEQFVEPKPGERQPRPFNLVGIDLYWRAFDFEGDQRQDSCVIPGFQNFIPTWSIWLRSALRESSHEAPFAWFPSEA